MEQPVAHRGRVRACWRTACRWLRLPATDGLSGSAALLAALLSILALYAGTIAGLIRTWWINPEYAHGFLIAPLCVYLVWRRRRQIAALEKRPSAAGGVVVALSLCLFVAGQLGAEQFLARVSLIGVLAGSVVFLMGWAQARLLALVFGLALLAIPLPAIVFNQIALPLQLLASAVAEETLVALSIPVLREGNVIFLSTATLEVAEACSGIRSLFSLLATGLVYGYFTDDHVGRRTLLALGTLPIAITANAARVAGTGVLAHFSGPEAADGFFHGFAGWLVFMSALLMLFALHRALLAIAPGGSAVRMIGEATR